MSWCCKPLSTSLDWRSQLNYGQFMLPVFVYNWLMFNFKCKSLLSNSDSCLLSPIFDTNCWPPLVVTQAGTVLQCPVPSGPYTSLYYLLQMFSALGTGACCFLPLPWPSLMGEYRPHPFICALCVWPWPTHAETEQKSFGPIFASLCETRACSRWVPPSFAWILQWRNT